MLGTQRSWWTDRSLDIGGGGDAVFIQNIKILDSKIRILDYKIKIRSIGNGAILLLKAHPGKTGTL